MNELCEIVQSDLDDPNGLVLIPKFSNFTLCEVNVFLFNSIPFNLIPFSKVIMLAVEELKFIKNCNGFMFMPPTVIVFSMRKFGSIRIFKKNMIMFINIMHYTKAED